MQKCQLYEPGLQVQILVAIACGVGKLGLLCSWHTLTSVSLSQDLNYTWKATCADGIMSGPCCHLKVIEKDAKTSMRKFCFRRMPLTGILGPKPLPLFVSQFLCGKQAPCTTSAGPCDTPSNHRPQSTIPTINRNLWYCDQNKLFFFISLVYFDPVKKWHPTIQRQLYNIQQNPTDILSKLESSSLQIKELIDE